MFCSLLTRCIIPCACHAKRHLNVQKYSEPSVLYTFDFEMCFAPQWRALVRHHNFQKWSDPSVFFTFWLPFHHLNFQKWSEHGMFCTFWLPNVLRATTACTFSTSQLPKVVRTWCVLYILSSTCASHHDGVHFFDISTSKSGLSMVCLVHFDLEMCFAPQRRALFRHVNFQKWSDVGVFCTFWLRNVLRATTARNFSSLIWPAGSAPAALASLLFDPPEKNTMFRDFPTFSRTWIFFLLKNIYISRTDLLFDILSSSLLFSSLTLLISAFHRSMSSEVWVLNFLRLIVLRNPGYPVVIQFFSSLIHFLALPGQASEGSCLNRDHLRKYHKTCKPRDSDAVSGVKPRGFHVSCFYVSFIILNWRRHWVMTKNRDTIRIDPVFLLKSVGPCNHHTDSNPIVNWSWATICVCVKIGYPKISCLIITFASSRAQGLLWSVPYFSEKRMMGLESTVAPPNLIFHIFFLSNWFVIGFLTFWTQGYGSNF